MDRGSLLRLEHPGAVPPQHRGRHGGLAGRGVPVAGSRPVAVRAWLEEPLRFLCWHVIRTSFPGFLGSSAYTGEN
jgi:hypothetical protein